MLHTEPAQTPQDRRTPDSLTRTKISQARPASVQRQAKTPVLTHYFDFLGGGGGAGFAGGGGGGGTNSPAVTILFGTPIDIP